MKEAGAVIDSWDTPLYWHDQDASAGYIPDSRALWDALWEHRGNLMGFAHTHPGSGCPGTSTTDLTSFAAIESGLGLRLLWWVLSRDVTIVGSWEGPGPLDYHFLVVPDPPWARTLREISQYAQEV